MNSPGTYDAITQTLSSPPPPMLDEIMATYGAQVDGDKDMLAAVLRAKEAEELRVAAVANLQQTIVHLQYALARLPEPKVVRSSPTPTRRPRKQGPRTRPDCV